MSLTLSWDLWCWGQFLQIGMIGIYWPRLGSDDESANFYKKMTKQEIKHPNDKTSTYLEEANETVNYTLHKEIDQWSIL